ncbi:MAG TPA: FGGY family carbohydrate kinase [Steroidobacteraceae bacterium]|jgi:xylulokinase
MSDPAPERRLTLGIDLGTSAVKVVALGNDDAVMAEGAAGFATDGALPQQAEQQPADWLRATSGAMQALADELTGSLGADWTEQIAAIGLTGQLPTLVCLDDAQPLGAAITWKDGRADAWASTRVDTARRALMYARTGMPIDGRYLAPMLQYHFADRLGEVRTMLSAKDYLLSELTGLRLTEPSTAAGFGIYDLQERRFSEDLADFWHVPRALLPTIQGANTLAGPLNEAGAALLGLRAGIPVSTGAADSVCASFAMAGLDERVVSISFGSSAVVIGASAAARFDPAARYLLTPHVNEAWYGREMDLLAAGTGYRWLSDLFTWKDGDIDRHAAQSIPGAHGLCFPPYLAGGEQGALWNPRLQGALFGLGLRHSRADIARSFLEGVFFEIKRCIDVLAEAAPIDAVMISGNLVHSPSSTQMLADILHRAVGAVPDRSPAAIGAAMLARRIAGIEAEFDRYAWSRPLVEPDEPTAHAYAGLYRQYLARAVLCE